MEAGGLSSSRGRLHGVEMLSELVQDSSLETPRVVNKEKLQASGCPPTHLVKVYTNDQRGTV